ncbi:protein commissureless 2 homolog [Aethina tumida]|uniref:protein commissureless 2 homolog n=1 Tax=Aethina tumida TaxID=116153 RepID=UPI00096AEE21|nr:protein commissureless 2 homolog [Aethina tumida]
MDEGLMLTFRPSNVDFDSIDFNNTSILIAPAVNDVSAITDPEYEQFLADVWVGIVLTLMVLSCVCFMCSCLIYHKFQQWKSRVIEARNAANLEAGVIESELPSYTIASGLPSYEEALEQLKKVKELSSGIPASKTNENWVPRTPPTPINSLSVVNLFQYYKQSELSKPT